MTDELADKIVAGKSTKRATKQLIYENALRLFATKSYARTGLRDIAQGVGIEVASLYSHIKGKNELLFDLMDYGTRDLYERLNQAAEQVADDPVGRLFGLVREHVAITCRRQHQTLVTFNEMRELNEAQLGKIMPVRRDIETLYISCVQDAIDHGRMRPTNVRVTVNGILSMIRGVASWYRADGALSPEEVGEHHADQVLRGLLTTSVLAELGDDPIDSAALGSLEKQA